MTAQVFQNTKINAYLLQVRFSANFSIPKEIWISNLEAPPPPAKKGNKYHDFISNKTQAMPNGTSLNVLNLH